MCVVQTSTSGNVRKGLFISITRRTDTGALLERQGLRQVFKPSVASDAKQLKRWCQDVRASAQKMLPSSSTTPAAEALVISQALAAIKLPARSPQNVESQDITGEESNTVEEAGDRDKQY